MSKVIKETNLYNILNSKNFFWETKYPKEIPTIQCQEIIPNKCWVLNSVFTPEECKKFINLSNKIGFESLNNEYPVSYRNNTRFILSSPSLEKELYKRIKDFIPQELYSGSWKIDGLNDFFRFCKYEKGGIFSLHQDSSYIQNLNRRSWLTCMLYLNQTNGGNTRVFTDYSSQKTLFELPPKEGQIIIFDPDLWHDGDKLISGEKYIIRTEVMFIKQKLK